MRLEQRRGGCAGAGCVGSGDPPHDASATANMKIGKTERMGLSSR